MRFEFVRDSISFEKLDFELFVAGELEIISSVSTGRSERKARTELLKRLMYLSHSYDLSVMKSLYAAVLREVELGHLKWGESFQYVETAVLAGRGCKQESVSSAKRSKFVKTRSDVDETGKIWFCSLFQRNKCTHKSPHTMVVKGVMRLALHICAACWMKEKVKLEHPECSTACPHATD